MKLKPENGNKVYKIRQVQTIEIVAYVKASDWDEAEKKIDRDSYDCFPHTWECVDHETVGYDILDAIPKDDELIDYRPIEEESDDVRTVQA